MEELGMSTMTGNLTPMSKEEILQNGDADIWNFPPRGRY